MSYMKCLNRFCFFLLFCFVMNISNGSMLEAKSIKIGKVVNKDDRSREIVVNTSKVLRMGQKIYIQKDGKKVFLNVVFPMMTVSKCRLIWRDRKYYSSINGEMPVYIDVAGAPVEKVSKNFPKGKHCEVREFGGIEFVCIESGYFQMGSKEFEGTEDEKPKHRVCVSSFWIAKYEITQEQYKAIMEVNPSEFKGSKKPVENVEWYNAMDFCSRFSSKNDVILRLPTEAEWEYACRAGTDNRFVWGNAKASRYCWHLDNSGNLFSEPKTHVVGKKDPNAWGLYDMLGNVYEWCYDWYGENYYQKSPLKNPTGPSGGDLRVIRGSCWGSMSDNMRPGLRQGNDPSRMFNTVGFRPVISSFEIK